MYEARFTIRHAHVDHFGIAYFPRIIELCHQSYEGFWDSVGMPYARFFEDLTIGFPVVSVQADFQRPLRHSELVVDRITVSRIGRSSVDWVHQLFVGDEPAATLRIRTVAVQMGKGGGSLPLPASVREALTPLLTGESP